MKTNFPDNRFLEKLLRRSKTKADSLGVVEQPFFPENDEIQVIIEKVLDD